MSSNSHRGWFRIVWSLLALATLAPLHGQPYAGGSILAAWPTAQPRCASEWQYYMPLRVYNDQNFTSEINAVLAQNRADGAERANIPIYYYDFDNPQTCSDFYANSSGSLPAPFTQNIQALLNYLSSQGYGEVTFQLNPNGGFIAQCDPSHQMWCGSSTQWGQAHQDVLDRNITIMTNIVQSALDNNSGLWVDFVLYMPSIQADRNCAHYESGYCYNPGTANLLYHTTYGLEAKYVTMLWDALANHGFSNGSIPGKWRIYGFETSYTPFDPAFQKIPTLYTVPQYGSGVTITGLYNQTSAGTPYVVAIGDYPDYGTWGAWYNLISVFLELGSAGDQSGIIIIETWYNDSETAAGYRQAVDQRPDRTVWFLYQWPWQKPQPGSSVVPWNFTAYHAYGF